MNQQQEQDPVVSAPRKMSFMSKLLYAAHKFINALAHRHDGTVIRWLLNLADLHASPSDIPVNGVKTSDHIVDLSRQLWFRMFLPVDAIQAQTSLPVIIYFHGGGFVQLSPKTIPFDCLCRRLAGDTPAVLISVNYRLAPEHKFPAQYDDGFDVLKFLDCEIRQKIPGFPATADLRRCFLAGDSAGGNIIHHVAARCARFEFNEVSIRGLISIQPFFGGEERTESDIRFKNGFLTLKTSDFFWKAFLPNGSNRDHPATNVFGPRPENNIRDIKFPPVVVFVGGWDLLQDWGRKYVDMLKRSGKEVELVEYPNVEHAFYVFGFFWSAYGFDFDKFPECNMLIAKVGAFVEKQELVASWKV